jgi:hypothetical protein
MKHIYNTFNIDSKLLGDFYSYRKGCRYVFRSDRAIDFGLNRARLKDQELSHLKIN